MNLVVFGLSVSSSWGNGHATLWRGMCASLGRRGHRVTFFERITPYYAAHRDLVDLPGGKLIFYADWAEARTQAQRCLAEADVAMITSYCPDALAATELILASNALRVYYDLDTGVTLDRLVHGQPVDYIGPRGLRDMDLVLSYTGGRVLKDLQTQLGARRVAPLYGHVDPAVHRPVPPDQNFRSDLSYLGTYAADRNEAVRALFVEPARRLPGRKFLMGGAQYDGTFPWQPNIFFMEHVPPASHPAFYCSSKLTLNVTRRAMAATGYCPSGRLFEAAACGTPVISDRWEGLHTFFTPGTEILVANTTGDVIDALDLSPRELARIAEAARERVLRDHTSDVRARELENILQAAWQRTAAVTETA